MPRNQIKITRQSLMFIVDPGAPGEIRTPGLLIRRLSLITLIVDNATVSLATFAYIPGFLGLLNTILNTTFSGQNCAPSPLAQPHRMHLSLGS